MRAYKMFRRLADKYRDISRTRDFSRYSQDHSISKTSTSNLFEPRVVARVCNLRYYIILLYVYILFEWYNEDLSSAAVLAKVIF